MVKKVLSGMLLMAALGAALAFTWHWVQNKPKPPDSPVLLLRMREVARLEALEVSLYKKISFEPIPPPGDSLWEDAVNWAKFTLRPPRGKAIVFGVVHLGVDLTKMDISTVQLKGERAYVSLPPIRATVELQPGETEVIGSNLDSEQTAQLLESAKEAFERTVMKDEKLQQKAKASAQRALTGLFLSLGYKEVIFRDGAEPFQPL
jgi:hypothetical protein